MPVRPMSAPLIPSERPSVTPAMLAVFARATTPEERIHATWLRKLENGVAQQRYIKWLGKAALGDPERAARVLARRKFTTNEWMQGLSEVEPIGQENLPGWTEALLGLQQMLQKGRHIEKPAPMTVGEVVGPSLPDGIQPEQPWRFQPGFDSWMAHARMWTLHVMAECAAPMAPEAVNDLVLSMIRRMLGVAGPVLMLESTLCRDKSPLFAGDVEHDWACIWEKYPVLVRLMAVVWEQWKETTEELVRRIGADVPALEPHARVTSIEAGRGDCHSGGRSVVELTLDNGHVWFLKPRNSAAHQALTKLLAKLDTVGAPLGIRLPDTFERDQYAWVRQVRRQASGSTEQVRQYYFRFGALLRLLQAIAATDLHHENFIPASDQAILVDLETAFGLGIPTWSDLSLQQRSELEKITADLISDTPFSTSMVSSPVDGLPGKRSIDIGALAGPEVQLTPYSVASLSLEKSGPQLVMTRVPFSNGGALPRLDGRMVPVNEHHEAVMAGYEDVQERLCRLSEIDSSQIAKNVHIRFVSRPTQVYTRLLQQSLQPSVLRDGVEREIVLERLWLAILHAPTELIEEEQRALRLLDIPLFWIRMDEVSLRAASGNKIRAEFTCSPVENLKKRLHAVSRRTDQLDDLRASLFAVSPQFRARCSGTEKPQPFENPAEFLLRHAIRSSGGALDWTGLTYDPCRFRWRYERLGPNLLGAAGVGLALLAATMGSDIESAVLPQIKATLLECARRMILADTRWLGSNAYSGPAGTLYALAKASRLTGDHELEAAATQMIPCMLAACEITGSGPTMGPVEGGVLALLQLADSPARQMALERLADRLMKPVSPTGDKQWAPWLCSLPSWTAGVALARFQLAAIPGFHALASANALPEMTPTETCWHPGDAMAWMMTGQIMSTSVWEGNGWSQANTVHRILDCANLARTAWLVTNELKWLMLFQRAWTQLCAIHRREGRWFSDIIAPDSRNFSAVHGVAAIASLALEGACAKLDIRVMQ